MIYQSADCKRTSSSFPIHPFRSSIPPTFCNASCSFLWLISSVGLVSGTLASAESLAPSVLTWYFISRWLSSQEATSARTLVSRDWHLNSLAASSRIIHFNLVFTCCNVIFLLLFSESYSSILAANTYRASRVYLEMARTLYLRFYGYPSWCIIRTFSTL